MSSAQIVVTSFNFALFVLYLVTVLFIALQLGRIVYYRHKLRSFQVGFLVQCFFWGLLRCIFFLLLDFISDTNWLLLLIYWLPINIQYSTFSLLVVYYAYLNPIHEVKAEMRKFKRVYISVWLATNILFLIGSLVTIVLGIKYDDPYEDEPDWLTAVHGYFTGGVFLILVLVLAYHGFKIYHLMRHGPRSKLLAKISLPKIFFVTLVLFLLFTSRCAYDFIMAAGVTSIDISSGTDSNALFSFVAFCAWEIIPIILVFILFGNVTSTTLGAFSNICRCFNTKEDNDYLSVNYQRISNEPGGSFANTLNKAQLFNNPKRYDSDEENSSQKTSPVHGSLNSPYNVAPIHSIQSSVQ